MASKEDYIREACGYADQLEAAGVRSIDGKACIEAMVRGKSPTPELGAAVQQLMPDVMVQVCKTSAGWVCAGASCKHDGYVVLVPPFFCIQSSYVAALAGGWRREHGLSNDFRSRVPLPAPSVPVGDTINTTATVRKPFSLSRMLGMKGTSP